MAENTHSPAERPAMRVAVVIEKVTNNYSAVVTQFSRSRGIGETLAEVEREISAAIRYHLVELREDGMPIPAPSCQVHFVEAPA